MDFKITNTLKVMKSFSSYRQVNALACLLCVIYLITAFLIQNYQALLPCPLCMLQRWIIGLLLAIFLIASIHARSTPQARFYAAFTFVISLVGIFLSGRHLWLLHHPPKTIGVCSPDLFYLFKQLPFPEAVKTLFWGSGDCATMAGYFWGLSLPSWTLLGFLSLAVISLWQIIRKHPSMPRW